MALRKLDEIKQQANSLSDEEKLELAQYLIGRARTEKYPIQEVDLSNFYGIVKFREDAMEMQKRWRAEWD
jgi:hypothetical protein